MISLTQGDALPITLTCPGLDLTGAVLTTSFQTNAADLVIPNSQHTIDPDQVANKGKFVVALTTANTNAMAFGTELSLITKVVQGASVVQFHGNKILTVQKATLR